MNLKVAVLEDNKDQLKARVQILNEAKIAEVVVWATNSEEFFIKLKDNPVDALFLDIDLGGDNTDGLQIAHDLKLPVLFVSGNNASNIKEIESIQRDYDLIVYHITKPFSDENFIKVTTRFVREVKDSKSLEFVYLDFSETKKNKIKIDTIVYLESETGNSGKSNNKRIYFTNRESEKLIDFSFSKMESKGFNKNKFLTIHRSFIVNAKHIQSHKKSSQEIEVKIFKSNGELQSKFLKTSDNFKMA